MRDAPGLADTALVPIIVTTLGVPEPPQPAAHETAREAWADYRHRISDLMAAGYKRGPEGGRYGGTEWSQRLTRGAETATVRLETPQT
jgi:hypothetical protein